MTAPAHDPYASLRIRDFRRFILSQLCQTLGSQIQVVVVGWQVYGLTRDPLSLGLVGLAEAVPFIGLALIAGQVADRFDRRRVALAATSLSLLCALALLGLTRFELVSPSRVWPIYLVVVASGVARSFLQPSRVALAVALVPRELLPNAITWRTSTWQGAAVAGPALGGLLYGWSGPMLAYGADALLLALSVMALLGVRGRFYGQARREGEPSEGLLSGIRFLRTQPILLGALTLDLFAVLFGGAEALLPIFAAEILHVGPEGLGLLRAAPAAGAVVTSLYLSHRPPLTRAGRDMLVSVVIYGLCIIGFALSRNLVLSLALLFVSGLMDNVSVIIRSTMLQMLTPQHLLGRVAAVNAIFIGASNEVGAFESGVAARLMGTVAAVIFGGCMTLGVVAVVAWKVPALRKLERLT